MGNSDETTDALPERKDEAIDPGSAETPDSGAGEGLRSISKAIGDVALWRLGFDNSEVDGEAAEQEVGPTPAPPAKRAKAKRRLPWWAFPILGVILAAIACAGFFVALVQTSTASITLSTSSDELDVPALIVASASASAGFQGEIANGLDLSDAESIPARPIEVVISESGKTPVFGSRVVPDQTALGVVQLTNPFPTAQSVPAQTMVGVVDGISYFTTEDVTVPAGDPYGSLSYGKAEAQVVASESGPVGNIPSGSLVGQLANGVYVLNEEPVSGGSNKSIPAVSDEDRLVLRQQLEEKIRNEAMDALAGKLEKGQQMIAPSLAFADWQEEYDQPVGAEVQEVGLVLKSRVTALVYSQSDVDQATARLVERALAKRDTRESKRTVEGVSHSEPQLMRVDPEKAILQTEIRATVHYGFDEGSLSKIRAEIAGKTITEAKAQLSSLPHLKSFDLLLRQPEWLPWDRLPSSINRITVTFKD